MIYRLYKTRQVNYTRNWILTLDTAVGYSDTRTNQYELYRLIEKLTVNGEIFWSLARVISNTGHLDKCANGFFYLHGHPTRRFSHEVKSKTKQSKLPDKLSFSYK